MLNITFLCSVGSSKINFRKWESRPNVRLVEDVCRIPISERQNCSDNKKLDMLATAASEQEKLEDEDMI